MTAFDIPGTERPQKQQLSFDVGLTGSPDLASIKIAGKMPCPRDLHQDERVHIRVTTMDGELLVSYEGTVEGVGFTTKRDEFGDVQSVERAHTVKLG